MSMRELSGSGLAEARSSPPRGYDPKAVGQFNVRIELRGSGASRPEDVDPAPTGRG